MPAASIPEGSEVAAGAPAGDVEEQPAEIARAPMRIAVATRFTDHSPWIEPTVNIRQVVGVALKAAGVVQAFRPAHTADHGMGAPHNFKST